ncbi:type-F conjugative transfer system secretin TraK [Allochromatium humboldtianum]|uniref:Type-F conjugative transfer system secretin TraK n=1 Tax=Allochromatium humboldtianum TaxID=504901 RepID=A0A850REU1_9GAMM|nr:type-F conjugative transfer system secretin TraK [Allochromatium humboldtianum]NVZ11515.1 type-F conjugative transfer system secretin TraK [Allochromatium humboldtianum]
MKRAVLIPLMCVAQAAAANGAAAESAAGSGRFVERPGTGKSETVSQAPVPSVPLAAAPAPLADVERSIEQARQAGGIPMDPALRDIHLPGLKNDDPSLRPWVLHTRLGVNEVVKLSASLINRIATPFRKPILIDPSSSSVKIIGSDVYYTPASSSPIGIFIVDSENKNQTISLTVIPTDGIPGQNLIVKLEDLRAAEDLTPNAPRGKGGLPGREADYTSYVRAVMTQALRGKVDGFSNVPLEGGVAKMGDLQITPDLVFTGSIIDIYRYRISNSGKKALDLHENNFYRKGVRAVAFFPRLSLAPNEDGYVFILADKPGAGR